jgi:hypothetical protein
MSQYFQFTPQQQASVAAAIPFLAEYHESPDWVHYFNPTISQAHSHQDELKLIPGGVINFLHKESQLLMSQVDGLHRFINHADQVIMYDLGEASGVPVAPFVYHILESEQKLTYSPVTLSSAMNNNATRYIKNFVGNMSLETGEHMQVDYQPIVANPERETFQSESVLDQGEDLVVTKLFTLLDSYLGTSMTPEVLLNNIYQSMDHGDFLVLSQGVFHAGREDALLSDYRSWITAAGAWPIAKGYSKVFNPEAEFWFRWDDASEVQGVKVGFTTATDIDTPEMSLNKGTDLTMFRTMRFEYVHLLNMLKKVGVNILQVNFDESMDNALIFCQK